MRLICWNNQKFSTILVWEANKTSILYLEFSFENTWKSKNLISSRNVYLAASFFLLDPFRYHKTISDEHYASNNLPFLVLSYLSKVTSLQWKLNRYLEEQLLLKVNYLTHRYTAISMTRFSSNQLSYPQIVTYEADWWFAFIQKRKKIGWWKPSFAFDNIKCDKWIGAVSLYCFFFLIISYISVGYSPSIFSILTRKASSFICRPDFFSSRKGTAEPFVGFFLYNSSLW